MEEITKVFSYNLKKRRTAAGLTQASLGGRIGYSEKAVSKWERGMAIPPTEGLLRLADALGTGLDELFSYCAAPAYYLGIDGGGTKTLFLLADREGRILRRIQRGSSNPFDIGFEKAAAVLEEGIRAAAAEIPYRKIAAYAGLSGGSTGDMKERFAAFFGEMRFASCRNGSDAENAVAAGLRGGDGVSLIAGTGAVAFAVKNGVKTRFGGYGYLFDEGGSGYDVGREAIRAACLAEEGRGDAFRLREMILAETKKSSMRQSLADLYAAGKCGIAAFSPLVFRAYREGDRTAAEIVRRQAEAIAGLLSAAVPAAGTDKDGKVPVVLTGGLTGDGDILLPLLRQEIEKKKPARPVTVSIAAREAAYGALLLAGMKDGEGDLS